MSAGRGSIWGGLLGTTVAPSISRAESTQTQKIKVGKRVVPPLSRQGGERKALYNQFIRQLESALCERARTAEWLHGEMAIVKDLQTLVRDFHKAVIQTIQATLGRRKSGSPTTLNDARQLGVKLYVFESKLESELTHDHKHALDLAFCMRDLCDDVRHYILQIEMTAGVVFMHEGKPKINNRPTNWSAKQMLGTLIMDFKNFHGDEAWPSGSAMCKALKKSGYVCSERAVRGWLNQIKSGSAGLLVQHKKGRQ